jgi:hypothetical protein
VVGLALFILMSPFLYRLSIRYHDSVRLAEVGVSIEFRPDGAAEVTVDGQTEVIPRVELERSSHYQEAMRRITSRMRMGQPYFHLCWPIVFVLWLPAVVVAGVVLFWVWPIKKQTS